MTQALMIVITDIAPRRRAGGAFHLTLDAGREYNRVQADYMNRTSTKPTRRPWLRAAIIILTAAMLASAGCKAKERLLPDSELLVRRLTPPAWTELEPGLESTELLYQRKDTDRTVAIVVLRVDPNRFRFRVLSAPDLLGSPAGWVKDLAAKAGVIAAVNASFYLPGDYEPTGLVAEQGKIIHPWLKNAGSGVFRARAGLAAVEWALERSAEWDRDDVVLQAGPLLIEPGVRRGIYSDTRKHRERTAVGIDPKGRVILLCTRRTTNVEDGLTGLDLYELMLVMIAKPKEGGLGLVSALNFDGGVSSAMSVNHPGLTLEIDSAHVVRNALAIEKAPPAGSKP
jgi:hypothetical protein